MSNFVRVPPDSTGKRISATRTIELQYHNGTTPFKLGDIVVGATSSAEGVVILIDGTTQAGHVHVLPRDEMVLSFTAGEILNVGGVSFAALVVALEMYFNNTILVGANNPAYGVKVDARGAMYIRGPEGSDQYDSYGRHQVSNAITLADYVLSRDDLPHKFGTTNTGAGTSTYNATQFCVVLSVGTVTGDKVLRRSHLWHKNQTGVSQLVEISYLCGDTGKTGLTRKWGYYDDANGARFELRDNILYAVFRSSVSGSMVDLSVPQSEWSNDRLDGTTGEFNPSNLVLDVAKNNSYWFDMQCSAGHIRMGLTIDGVRIICHKFSVGNTYSTDKLIVGTLPISYEIENTGSTASSSESRIYCSNIKSEGDFTPPEKLFSGNSGPVKAVTTRTPIMSFRPIEVFKGKPNRVWTLPVLLHVYSDTATVLFEIVKNGTLVGSVFGAADSETSMEADISATSISSGSAIYSQFAYPNLANEIDLTRIFSMDNEVVARKATITDAPDTYTICCTSISGTSTNVKLAANWKELQ